MLERVSVVFRQLDDSILGFLPVSGQSFFEEERAGDDQALVDVEDLFLVVFTDLDLNAAMVAMNEARLMLFPQGGLRIG